MRTLIRKGMVIDGSCREPSQADVLIENDTIIKVARNIKAETNTVIDAKGYYVTPGFIDIHTHTDLANFTEQGLKPKIMQGVTTEIVGQCGLGVAPVPAEIRDEFRKRLIIGNPDIKWAWQSFGEYLNRLRNHGIESNLGAFVPHGVIRYLVAGDNSTPLDSYQLNTLSSLIDQCFQEGAMGLSLGLIYHPALFANTSELEATMQIAARYGRPVAVHMRSESDTIIEAFDHIASIANRAGARIHISHLKLIGHRNAGKLSALLDRIERHRFTFDQYPYNYGSTTLLSILPPPLFNGRTFQEVLQDLKNSSIRKTINDWFTEVITPPTSLPWDNLPALVGWDNIRISDVQTSDARQYLGLSLEQCAEITGQTPTNFMLDLLVQQQGQVRMIDHYMSEELITRILQHPRGVVGSDTLLGGQPHPRVYGTFPRVVGHYAIRKNTLPLKQAVHKMTGASAQILGLSDRGFIQKGMKADIAVFSPEFTDRASLDSPERFAQGLEWLFINGQEKVGEGQYRQQRSGTVLTA